MSGNKAKIILGFSGVITVYIALMSYGLVTGYYSGYLSHFNIDIRYIDFWPSLHDFMTQAFPSILAIIALSVSLFVVLLIINFIYKLLNSLSNKYKKLNWLNSFSLAGTMSYGYMSAVVLLGVLVFSFNIVFNIAVDRGASEAQKQSVFPVIISEDTDSGIYSVAVYQNNDRIIIKNYDTSSGLFTDSYKVSDFSDKEYMLKDINRHH